MLRKLDGIITREPALIEFRRLFSEKIKDFRVVGGFVRNYLIGTNKSGIDIATTLTPNALQEFCLDKNIKFFEIGGAYGSIGINILGQTIEITSTRLDIKAYGRQADVEYVADWRLDSKRRDFTINALYVDFDEILYDFHGGQTDLANKKIKFIGAAQDRINEDYLRIIRAFRFSCELPGFTIDGKDIASLEANISKVKELSKERIKSELFRIFRTKAAPIYLQAFQENGLLRALDLDLNSKLNFVHKWESLSARSEIIFIAILNQDKDFKQLKYNLALSNGELSEIRLIIKFMNCKIRRSDICQLRDENKMQVIEEILTANYLISEISLEKYQENLEFADNLELEKFPISGNDLKIKGITDGIEIGKVLKDLKSKWYQSEYKLSREELLEMVEML